MTEEQDESKNVRFFKFNRDSGEFEDIPMDTVPEGGIKEILKENPTNSYALFQLDKYMVWLYHGEETSVQTKFISARGISRLRDDILIGGKIVTVDEGSEPLPFQFITKMADPADYGIEEGPAQYKPAYTGSEEDLSMIEKLSLERICLLLEQVPTPNGFEREAIIHDNELYAVKNARRSFMGTELEEIELVPLPKDAQIESGTYLADSLTPRLLFENNRLVLIELLRKTETRKQQESLFNQFT